MPNQFRCPEEAEAFSKASLAFEEAIKEQRAFFDEIWDWENNSPKTEVLQNNLLRENYRQKAKELERLVEERSKERLEAFFDWADCEVNKAQRS